MNREESIKKSEIVAKAAFIAFLSQIKNETEGLMLANELKKEDLSRIVATAIGEFMTNAMLWHEKVMNEIYNVNFRTNDCIKDIADSVIKCNNKLKKLNREMKSKH